MSLKEIKERMQMQEQYALEQKVLDLEKGRSLNPAELARVADIVTRSQTITDAMQFLIGQVRTDLRTAQIPEVEQFEIRATAALSRAMHKFGRIRDAARDIESKLRAMTDELVRTRR